MIYFTDTCSNLTPEQAKELGVILLPGRVIYNGELYYDTELPVINSDGLTTSALNQFEYQQLFEPYRDEEKVYVSYSQKQSSTFENLKKADIPKLTVIDSGFISCAQMAVLKRVMNCKPYDDIRFFFVTKNKNKKARVNSDNYSLFEMVSGEFVKLEDFESREDAIDKLKKLVTSELCYGNGFNNSTLLHHMGKDFIGGFYECS